MKTLINKQNPEIRITAPEIVLTANKEEYWIAGIPQIPRTYLAKDWTLVEEEPEEDLEKVAEEYANKEHPDEPCVGKWGTGDYEPPIDREYDREIAKDAFKAGIRWMEERGKTNNYKPTKEQIEFLSKAIFNLGEEGDGKTAAVLNELRKDLKNL